MNDDNQLIHDQIEAEEAHDLIQAAQQAQHEAKQYRQEVDVLIQESQQTQQ